MREFDNLFLATAIWLNAVPVMNNNTPEPPLDLRFNIQRVGADVRVSLTRSTITAIEGLLRKNREPLIITADSIASDAANHGLFPPSPSNIDLCADAIARDNPLLFTGKDPKGKPKRAISITPHTPANVEFVISLPSECTGKRIDAKTSPPFKSTPAHVTPAHHGEEGLRMTTRQEQPNDLRTTVGCVIGMLAIAGIAVMCELMSRRLEYTPDESTVPPPDKPPKKHTIRSDPYDYDDYYESPCDNRPKAEPVPTQTILPPDWPKLNRAPQKEPIILDGKVVIADDTTNNGSRNDETQELFYQGFYRNPATGEFDVVPKPEDYNARTNLLRHLAIAEPELLQDILDGKADLSTQDVRESVDRLNDTVYVPLTPDNIKAIIETGIYEREEDDPLEDGDPDEDDEGLTEVHGDKGDVHGTTGPEYLQVGDDADEPREPELPTRQLLDDEEQNIGYNLV